MKNKILRELLKKRKWYIIANIILLILVSVMLAYSSYVLRYLGIAIEEKSFAILSEKIVYIVFIMILTLGIIFFSGILNAKVMEKLRYDLRQIISKKIINTSYLNFNNNDSGKYISWYTNDITDISTKIFNEFFLAFNNFALMASSLFAMFYINYLIGLASLILFAISASIPKLYLNNLQQTNIKRTNENEKYTENIKNLILGFNVFYTNNILKKYFEKSNVASKDYEANIFKINVVTKFFQTINFLISMLSQIVLSTITVYVVIKYGVNVGAIVAVLSLSGQFFSSTNNFVNNLSAFSSNTILLDKYKYENLEIKNIDNKNIKLIDIRNLSFSYGDKKILENINLKFEYPKKYFVIGESGSGKSTLTKLIMGLYPNNGSIIYIDEENIEYKNKLNDIAYISQDIYLFNTTLKENICLFSDYSQEKIMEILDKVQLKEFVESLDKGLDTEIKENGKNLSGGQKQRIALARALIQDKRYIIIDEGTSQLDKENSQKIEEIILKDEKLCAIIVTHHFSYPETEDYEIIKL